MLRQASTYLAAHMVSAILGFLSIVVFTHLLTPDQYGLYVVVMGLAGVISAIAFSWIRLSVVRFNHGGPETDMRGTALVCYMGLLLLAPVTAGIASVLANVPFWQGAFAVLVAFLLAFFEFGQDIFRVRQEAGSYARAVILRSIASFALSMVFVLAGYGGEGFLIGICLGYALAALVSARSVWRAPRRGFDQAILRNLVHFGVPMTISGGAFALHALLDRLIILAYLGEAGAGTYGAVADLVRQIILFPSIAIGSAIIPVAARLLANDEPVAARHHLERSAELLLAVVLPAVVGLALVARPLSQLMLGAEFREAGETVMPILAFSWLFQAITQQYVHASFHLGRKPSMMLYQGLAMLAVNLGAMFLLVPSYGLVGAAWALVFTEFCGMVLGYVLSFRAQPLSFRLTDIGKVTLATAIMAGSTFVVLAMSPFGPALSLLIAVSVGIAAYGLSAILLDVLSLRATAWTMLGRLRARLA
ncbi:oligosaccharide flippase family protein [Shinella sumterensis]|uniref:oligosaccharide flippase family protein n=1 Tax=Shinella sumterensis TaxID=1967501 RepID=UPI003F8557BF